MQKLGSFLTYLKARLREPSTWAGISAAIVGATAFEGWEKGVLIALGIIGTLLPTSTACEEVKESPPDPQ